MYSQCKLPVGTLCLFIHHALKQALNGQVFTQHSWGWAGVEPTFMGVAGVAPTIMWWPGVEPTSMRGHAPSPHPGVGRALAHAHPFRNPDVCALHQLG